jgi:DNA-binding transcriptional MerR regulator/effector-binding domain-containing protein
MSTTLSIGDFSLMTHLSIKTLRYYHQVGLLEPEDVDPDTGYRHYGVEQLPTAQIIQRFRDLDMPIDEVKAVLAAPNLATRNALIATHLGRLEGELAQTRQAVQSLRNLLETAHAAIAVDHRTIPATPAVGIQDVVDRSDLVVWLHGALGELYATVAVQGVQSSGPSGGLFASELFQYERGEVTMFVPISGTLQTVGRVSPLVVPAAEVAVTVHDGSLANLNDTYVALGVYVAQHALGVVGPVREYYLVDARATSDATEWRTELAWPIFQTSKPHSQPEG